MILILTNKDDSHADAVIRNLSVKGIDIFRLNSEDLLQKYSLNLHIDENGLWKGEITDEVGRVLHLSKVKVAWFRKPDFDFFGRKAASPEEEFIVSETKALIDTLYSLPTIKWINDPRVANRSKIKFQQLILAHKYDVKVPRTLITTQPEAAIEFFLKCGEEVLVKTIYTNTVTISGMNQGIPSRRIGKDEFYRFVGNIAFCPTQLQEYVDKAFELRITIIGTKVFATRIDSQVHEETKIDWRLRTELNPHSAFELPPRIEKFCIDFLKEQGLLFGAMDFIVTPEGEFCFLENNPFGQYLWLEMKTGMPLTEAICDLLMSYLNQGI